MGRVISYGEKTGYNDGDYLLLDNGEGGTKRIRADKVGIQLDPTLTDPNKAAPANAVKSVDPTLSQSGQAADAKVVGDEINYTYFADIPMTFASGGISESGSRTTYNTRIRTEAENSPITRNGDYITVDALYQIKIVAYTSNKTESAFFVASTDTWENGKVKMPDNFIGHYIALLIRKVGSTSSDISGDVSTMDSHIAYRRIQSPKFEGDATALGYTAFSDIVKTGIYQIKTAFVNSATDSPVRGGQTAGGYLITIEADSAIFQNYYHWDGAIYSRYLAGSAFSAWGHMSTNNGTYGTGYNFSDITEFGASIIYYTMFQTANDSPERSNTKGGVLYNVPFGTSGVLQIAHSANGASYIRIRGRTSDAFQNWVTLGSKSEPWTGLRVSILGDSISSLSGYAPPENIVYYSGSNHGVTNVNQMWWYQAIFGNGATPLILDAWSGSLVCANVRAPISSNSYKPMSDTDRCRHLHGYIAGTQEDYDLIVTSENIESIRVSPFDSYVPAVGDYAKRIDPDIILMTGGGNDYSYDAPLGTWNGHTDLDPTALSTFREAYANTLNLIREEYPNALVICIKPWFFVRPGFSTLNKNQVNRNNLGLTYKDYFDVIEEIAGLMACPVVDGFTNGFNRYNYYNTFCTDASNNPTHPTGLGQKIMGKNLEQQMKTICTGYVQWLRGEM